MKEEQLNKKRRKRGGTLTYEQVEWAYAKWCAGYPLQEIADKLYVSPSTLYRSFKGRRRKRLPLETQKN